MTCPPGLYRSTDFDVTAGVAVCISSTGNFRFVVRSIFTHAQISITTETLQPPWLTETQGDGWVSGTLGRDMAANPLQALIMHSLRMFISVHKDACADFGLTLQTTNLKFPVASPVRGVVCPGTRLLVECCALWGERERNLYTIY